MDVVGRVGGEEHRGAGEFVGVTPAAGGDAVYDLRTAHRVTNAKVTLGPHGPPPRRVDPRFGNYVTAGLSVTIPADAARPQTLEILLQEFDK